MSTPNSNWLAWALLLLVAAAGGFWYWQQARDVEAPVERAEPAPPPTETQPEGPRYPVPDAPVTEDGELVELPPLGDSDAWFKLSLQDVFGPAVDRLLVDSAGIERFVATVDNLPRRKLAERLRPAQSVAGALAVVDSGDQTYTLDPANAARYSPYVDTFLAADPEDLVAAYRRFYPLLQEAYESLGYPNAYFNDRLVEVIDHLLLTPEIDDPVQLVRPHVLYEFTDPALESLSSGQKIMLRLGPGHAGRIKARLREIRSLLVAQPVDRPVDQPNHHPNY